MSFIKSLYQKKQGITKLTNIQNAFFGLLGFLIPTGVLFLASRILTDHLGGAVFGIYILATSFSGSLAFLDLGFSSATLKFVAEDIANERPDAASGIVATSLVFYGCLGTVGAFVIWILSPWIVHLFGIKENIPDTIWVFRIAAIQFAVFFLNTVFISLFKGLQRFDISSFLLATLSVLTYGLASVGIILFGIGLIGVTLFGLVANVMVLFLSLHIAFRLESSYGLDIRTARPSMSALRRMLGFGIALTVHSFTALFFTRMQRVLIGILLNTTVVTVYFLAITLVSKIHSAINSVAEITYPISSATQDLKRLKKIYLRMIFSSGAVAISFLVPLIFFSKQIVSLWLGDGNPLVDDVVALLPILSVAFFFLSLSPVPFHIFNGVGKPWINSLLDVVNISTFVTVLLSFYLLDRLLLVDFVWAFAVSNTVTGIGFQVAIIRLLFSAKLKVKN